MVFDESPNILVALRDRKVTDRFAYSLQVAPMALVAHCVIALSLGTPVLSFGQNSPEYLLSAKPEAGQVRRVKSVLEVDGELKLNPDGKQVTRLPLKVRGDLLYTERILEFDAEESKRQDARYYQTAEAAIQVGETNHQNLLRDSLRLVVVDAGSEQTNLFSPLGPLRAGTRQHPGQQCPALPALAQPQGSCRGNVAPRESGDRTALRARRCPHKRDRKHIAEGWQWRGGH